LLVLLRWWQLLLRWHRTVLVLLLRWHLAWLLAGWLIWRGLLVVATRVLHRVAPGDWLVGRFPPTVCVMRVRLNQLDKYVRIQTATMYI
jgi:hypothetical protein